VFSGLCSGEVMAAMTLNTLTLPYAEGMHWFKQVRDLTWPMLLESGQIEKTDAVATVDEEISLGARFDIVVAAPVARIIHRHPHTDVLVDQQRTRTEEDPFKVIQNGCSLILLNVPLRFRLRGAPSAILPMTWVAVLKTFQ
jgi:hypothetical protein